MVNMAYEVERSKGCHKVIPMGKVLYALGLCPEAKQVARLSVVTLELK